MMTIALSYLMKMRTGIINEINNFKKNKMEYLVKINCKKLQENGIEKTVKEQYIVTGVSFADIEKKAVSLEEEYGVTDFGIILIKVSPYKEIQESECDTWFDAKIAFTEIDEQREREKKTKYAYLFNAVDIDDARKKAKEFCEGIMSDIEIISITKTNILDWIK